MGDKRDIPIRQPAAAEADPAPAEDEAGAGDAGAPNGAPGGADVTGAASGADEALEAADGAHGEKAPAGSAPAEGERVEGDLDELVAAAAQRDEYLDLARRTQADFENYRKRMAREAAAAEQRGVVKLAAELLPALDNLERALSSADAAGAGAGAATDGAGEGPRQSPERLTEGIRLVQAELLAALRRLGVEAYCPTGERFDPAEHEAMAQHPAPGAESGTIIEVYQPGYRINGNVIRPARVVVAA